MSDKGVREAQCGDTTPAAAVPAGVQEEDASARASEEAAQLASSTGMIPELAFDAVMMASSSYDGEKVRGYDFSDDKVDYERLLDMYATTGFQATAFGQAVEELKSMMRWRLSDDPIAENEDGDLRTREARQNVRTTVFLGYTSCLISAGTRETIKFLVKNRLVSCIVTTAGGIEEDLIKCMADTYLGDFSFKGKDLRAKGLNRIGNLIVPNGNYCKFEDWIMPILDSMLAEQNSAGVVWTPSKIIARLGKEIDNEDSVLYWAAKNEIPIFCPAITDGSIGDMIYFHSFNNPGLVVDLVQDIRRMNNTAVKAKRTGMVILGGGLVKHHICNANLMRNGANHAVFVNTAHEFDGSDSGARPDEAISWGKIRADARPVKICAEASLVFPLLVAKSLAKHREYGFTAQPANMGNA